jgi:uroporphyrinogen III methyltransferase/synthase
VVTFTSSSTATNFLDLLGDEKHELLRDVCLASIGPVTSATLEKAGFKPTVEAREYTMGGLVEAISQFAAKSR